eukprot:1273059-Rhodomonas_salina.1
MSCRGAGIAVGVRRRLSGARLGAGRARDRTSDLTRILRLGDALLSRGCIDCALTQRMKPIVAVASVCDAAVCPLLSDAS